MNWRSEEYNFLRAEMLQTLKELESLERYAILVIAGIWAWVFGAEAEVDHALWIVMAGLVAVLLMGLKALGLHRHLGRMADYIRVYYEGAANVECPGWERYLSGLIEGPRAGSKALMHTRVRYLLWIGILLVGSVMAAITIINKLRL